MVVELTRQFEPEQYAEAIESWVFVDFTGWEPALATAFGDILFQGPGGFAFLDIEAGTFAPTWVTQNDLLADLNSPSGQLRYLRSDLVPEAIERLGEPDLDETFTFRRNLALGGSATIENVGIADFVVTVDLAGQIHAQIRRLPPGTRISGLTLR